MINYIYTNGSAKAVLFDDSTMEAKLVDKMSNDSSKSDIKKANSADRVVHIDNDKAPKMISRIVVDSISEDEIVLRNKNIRLKLETNHIKNYYYYNHIEKIIDIVPYQKKDDRVMTVDLQKLDNKNQALF